MMRNRVGCLLLVYVFGCVAALEFLTEPQDAVVMETQPYWWHCQASVSQQESPATYSWRFGEADAPTSSNQQVFPNGTLHIKQVTTSSLGTYQCIITSGSTTIPSQVVTMRLAEIDAAFSENPKTQAVQVKASVLLECSINSYPAPVITWLLGNEPVTRGSVTMVTRSRSQYTIQSVSYSDEGNYTCLATNAMLNQNVTSSSGLLTVRGQPILTTTPQPIETPTGSSAMFNCVAEGKPPPTLTWFFTPDNGAQVDAKTRPEFSVIENGSLTISKVTEDLSGLFTCRAENSEGEDSKTVRLTVTGPATAPVLTLTSKDKTVVEGGNVLFECLSTGNPAPTTVWSKVEGDLPSRVTYPTPQQLLITRVTSSDRGTYVCRVSNTAGSVVSSAKLSIQSGPSFIQTPQSLTVDESSKVELPCRAAGSPGPDISWTTPLTGVLTVGSSQSGIIIGGDGTLIISSVDYRHQGVYICTASNVVSSVTVTATLNVNSAPVFTVQPASQAAVVGDASVLFQCRVAGFPTPVITWYKEGESRPITNNEKYSLVNGGDLKVLNIEASDGGLYNCSAVNRFNKNHAIATLNIYVPPSFTLTPRDRHVTVGETVVLECLTSGRPVPVQVWERGGKTVVLENNMDLFPNNTLVIKQITQQQMGDYVCKSTNQGGQITATVTLSTKDVPIIVTAPTNRTVVQGNQMTITCRMTANSSPVISWYKSVTMGTRGTRIETNSRFRVHSTSDGDLVITSSQSVDELWYTCVGLNSVGETSTDPIFINVQVPPTIVKTNSPQQTTNQNTTTLSCDATGDPEPVLTWRSPRGVVITESVTGYVINKNNVTIVTASTASDGGEWTCVACNDVRCTEGKVQLLIQGAPFITGVATSSNLQTITLECKTTGLPAPVVTYFIDGQGATQSVDGHAVSNGRLTIDRLNIKEEYRCLAENNFGTDSRSMKKPGKPTKPQPNTIDSRWITLTWSDGEDSGLPVEKYMVEYKTGNIWTDGKISETQSATVHNITDLLPYTVYTFRVRVNNILDTSVYSEQSDSVQTKAGVPTEPENPRVSTSQKEIRVEFEQATNFYGDPADIRYQIDLKIKPTIILKSYIVLVNQTLAVRFTDVANGDYIVQLKTRNIKEESESRTVEIPVVVRDKAPVFVPKIKSATSLRPDAISVEWDLPICNPCSPPVTGFTVYIKHKVEDGNTTVVTVGRDGNKADVGGLEENSVYSVTVAAVNDGGRGNLSDPVTVTTLLTIFSEAAYQSNLLTDGYIIAIIGGVVGLLFLLLLLLVIFIQCQEIRKDPIVRYSRHSPRVHRFYLGQRRSFTSAPPSLKGETSSSWKHALFSRGKYIVTPPSGFSTSTSGRNVTHIRTVPRLSVSHFHDHILSFRGDNPGFTSDNEDHNQPYPVAKQQAPVKPKRTNPPQHSPQIRVTPPVTSRDRSNSVKEIFPDTPVDEKVFTPSPDYSSLGDKSRSSSSHRGNNSRYPDRSRLDNTLPELETLSRLFADIEAEEENARNNARTRGRQGEFYY